LEPVSLCVFSVLADQIDFDFVGSFWKIIDNRVILRVPGDRMPWISDRSRLTIALDRSNQVRNVPNFKVSIPICLTDPAAGINPPEFLDAVAFVIGESGSNASN
jgi:hypothetical protein